MLGALLLQEALWLLEAAAPGLTHAVAEEVKNTSEFTDVFFSVFFRGVKTSSKTGRQSRGSSGRGYGSDSGIWGSGSGCLGLNSWCARPPTNLLVVYSCRHVH